MMQNLRYSYILAIRQTEAREKFIRKHKTHHLHCFYLWTNANYIFISLIRLQRIICSSRVFRTIVFFGALCKRKQIHSRQPAALGGRWSTFSTIAHTEYVAHAVFTWCGQSQSTERVFHINFSRVLWWMQNYTPNEPNLKYSCGMAQWKWYILWFIWL